jgi:alpha-1,3-mannosyltransferase
VRILQVVRQFYPSTGGVETYTMALSRRLLNHGYECDVLTLNRCFESDIILSSEELVEGIRIIRIPYWGIKRFFIAPGVLQYLRAYDLIHVHNIDFFSEFLVMTKPFHRKPVVVSTHGGYFHTSRLAFLKKVYFHTITPFSLNHANQVIASSTHDYDIFAPLVPHIKLLEYSVDFGHFLTVVKEIEPGLMLYVGRLAENKQVGNLIRCLAQVRMVVPDAHLALVGPDFDNISEQLMILAQDLNVADAVIITGRVPDDELVTWMARAHIFVSASEYEAFGISVLEAMSTGTVPVVNPLKSFRHFIQNGQNGFFTNFSNADQAAQTVAEVLQISHEEIRTIGQQSKAKAIQYDWDNAIEDYINLYSRVAN